MSKNQKQQNYSPRDFGVLELPDTEYKIHKFK